MMKPFLFLNKYFKSDPSIESFSCCDLFQMSAFIKVAQKCFTQKQNASESFTIGNLWKSVKIDSIYIQNTGEV